MVAGLSSLAPKSQAMATSDDKARLETFDGSDPSAYRLWKRRAQLLVAGLPTTVPKEKYGPRLMEYIKGEAESLLESISVEDLTKEGGDKQIWAVLDDKYKPQERDLLQHALKNFFYDLAVKPSESYTQFLARFDAANRLLREQQIDLPSPVKGYMLLKKLKLEPTPESMVLTHTGSKLEVEHVIKAVRGIFPEGKGPMKNANKEVFQTEDMGHEHREVAVMSEDEELMEAAEAIATDHQERGVEDDEEALETFESYLDVRKRLREQKVNRGFKGGSSGKGSGSGGGDRWRLQGTVRGRLELLKSRTTCHLCHEKGHWKRECPRKPNARKESSPKKTDEVHAMEAKTGKEVLLAEDAVWKLFTTDGQRSDGEAIVAANGTTSESPTPEREPEIFSTEVLLHDAKAEDQDFEPIDEILGQVAVPDTACRRTIVGEYTLGQIERHLSCRGLKVLRREEQANFRFGNSQTLETRQAAIMAGQPFFCKGAIGTCSNFWHHFKDQFWSQFGAQFTPNFGVQFWGPRKEER